MCEDVECTGLASGDGDPGRFGCPLYGISISTNSRSCGNTEKTNEHHFRWAGAEPEPSQSAGLLSLIHGTDGADVTRPCGREHEPHHTERRGGVL